MKNLRPFYIRETGLPDGTCTCFHVHVHVHVHVQNFDTFHEHLVYDVVIWHILWSFGIFSQPML
jgi:hypothetical protein